MCNFIHTIHESIPEEGVGYKLFSKKGKEYKPICSGISYTFYGKFIKWNPIFTGDGFCFFLTRKEARRAQKNWNKWDQTRKYRIKKIQYKKGICKQDQGGFTFYKAIYKTALCKEFRILKDKV
jgi:hypothetical protein